MKQEKEEWVIGLYEDHFNCDDTYPSKEEAIKAGRNMMDFSCFLTLTEDTLSSDFLL